VDSIFALVTTSAEYSSLAIAELKIKNLLINFALGKKEDCL